VNRPVRKRGIALAGLLASVAFGLGACGSSTTPHASSAPTTPKTTTTTVPTTNAASTGTALDTQSVQEMDSELSGLQPLLDETASDTTAGQEDN
jgi:FlaG/FlaF family flagellin (archaellin)